MFLAAVSTLLIIAGGIGQAKIAASRPPRAASLHSNEQTIEIPRGTIIEKLVCANDAAQSYALYLPSSYTPARKWPILYAFDPGARGKLPVENYKDAAEKYGWIVAGSNNSRNGASQPSVDAWQAIVKDTHDRFTIDDRRVYLAGFSGGARLAIYFAAHCQDCVAGVIASGAGFPNGVTPSPALRFAIFTTTGVDDFNFPEVKTLDDELTKAGATHQTRVFAGRHEWPPSPVVTEAVEWMELQAMKSGQRDRDNALVDSIWESRLRQARELEVSNKIYQALQTYSALSESFKGLRDVSEVEKRVGQLRASREVKEALRDELEQMRKQRKLESQVYGLLAGQPQGVDAFGEADSLASGGPDRQTPARRDPVRDDRALSAAVSDRLHGLIVDLRKSARAADDTGDRRVARRVLEGMYVSFFEKALSWLTNKKYDSAIRRFQLMTEIDPDRPGPFFYIGWAYAADGDKKRSLQFLKTAVDKGFTDLAAIRDNKAFDSVRNAPQYQQLIEILKNKH